jgi:putative oxidoreductase
MKNCCPHNVNFGLLLPRLALAAVFMVHGYQKLANMDMTVGFFGQMGLHPAIAWITALVEFFGGLMMLLGLYTCIAGIGLAVIMLGAIWTVKWNAGFSGGWEFDMVLMLSALGVAMAGPGRYTVCCFMHGKHGKVGCCAKDEVQKEEGCCGGACSMPSAKTEEEKTLEAQK